MNIPRQLPQAASLGNPTLLFYTELNEPLCRLLYFDFNAAAAAAVKIAETQGIKFKLPGVSLLVVVLFGWFVFVRAQQNEHRC